MKKIKDKQLLDAIKFGNRIKAKGLSHLIEGSDLKAIEKEIMRRLEEREFLKLKFSQI